MRVKQLFDTHFFVYDNIMVQNIWLQLKKDLDLPNKILVLGEKHGAGANVPIINEFIKRLNIKLVMVEIESHHRQLLYSAVKGNKIQLEKLKKNWIAQSGVIGKEHLRLFAELIKQNKTIEPIKNDHKTWNTAEQKTAETIKKVLKKHKNLPTMIIMGSLHARKKSFKMTFESKTKPYTPLGKILSDQVITVRIRYGKGHIYNFGLRKVTDQRILQNTQKGLAKSPSIFFDYDYIIPKTKSIKLL